jgi:hypothetical protein
MSSFSALNAACLKTFGTPVSYQKAAGDPFTITGILQKDSEEERNQDGVYARLFVNLAVFPSRPDKGDFATVNETQYTVFAVEIDPAGAGRLSLRKRG